MEHSSTLNAGIAFVALSAVFLYQAKYGRTDNPRRTKISALGVFLCGLVLLGMYFIGWN